jgi:hypothetical protein
VRQIVDLDRLLAPILLHPDQLLAQMLPCAHNPPDGRPTQRPAKRATRVVKEMAQQPV